VLLVANGVGARRAGKAVEVVASRTPLSGVVSAGYCGALAGRLGLGDILVGTELDCGLRRIALHMPDTQVRFAAGRIASVDRVAGSTEEKHRLRESGADAVEMEAAGAAEAAARLGAPFYCIRSITDLPGESFAINFNAALGADGRFDHLHIFRQALRRPGVALPELLRLHRRCRAASKNLGEFLAHCRF
jgi:adenosylhomocysteine nucleosidase